VILLTSTLFTLPARSEPTGNEPPCPRDTKRRALAVGAALVPGIVVHGAGHWVLCERKTAGTLLAIEGAGAGLAVASATGLAATGASRYFVAPLALGLWGGASLFTLTLLADLYGVTAPPGGFGKPPEFVPRLSLETGVRFIYDPHFPYRVFASHGFRFDTHWLWLAPRIDVALDAKNQRYSLLAGHRLAGPTSRRRSPSGTRVDLELGVTDHDYGDEGFAMRIVEASVSGRLDLVALGETLRGSFAELQLGYARQWSRYDGLPGDGNDELLARAAFGAYLGHGAQRGEVKIGYDHRRDTLAGGLRMAGIGAGYLGFLHQRSELYLGKFGVASEVNYGSAAMFSLFFLMQLDR
jgi:hypothetical protein